MALNNPNLTGAPVTNKETEETREKFNISVSEHEEFPSIIASSITSLHDIMEKVSELFSSVYRDYAGCWIEPAPNGLGFITNLYFKATEPSSDDDAFAFKVKNYNAQGASGLKEALNIISNRSQQRVYEITEDGKDGLEKFVLNSCKKNNGQVNWGSVINEQVQNGPNNITFAVVSNIDIYKVLGEIYGHKTKEGAYYQYLLTVNRPIGQNVGYTNGVNWLVSLQRLEMKEFEKLCKQVGMISTQGIPMVSPK